MVCKTTFTRCPQYQAARRFQSAGFTLSEVVFAMGLGTLLLLVVCGFSVYSARSYAALNNYVDLDHANRLAVDQMTCDLRQCNRITAASATSLTIEDSDGSTLIYTYNPSTRTLVRAKNGIAKNLLTECDNLTFSLGQRNPVGGSYDVYPAATPATAKVVNASWTCSRKILGIKSNTESVQTARIVIRNQGT